MSTSLISSQTRETLSVSAQSTIVPGIVNCFTKEIRQPRWPMGGCNCAQCLDVSLFCHKEWHVLSKFWAPRDACFHRRKLSQFYSTVAVTLGSCLPSKTRKCRTDGEWALWPPVRIGTNAFSCPCMRTIKILHLETSHFDMIDSHRSRWHPNLLCNWMDISLSLSKP